MEPKYLEHLKGAIPAEAHGYTVSSYCMALEGWRRGLKVKFINQNRRKSELTYSFSNGEKEHVFSVARGDLVPREAIITCMNKDSTKKALLDNNVATPVGEVFGPKTNNQEFINYAEKIGYPVVVKPVDGTAGKGVITGIKDSRELTSSIDYIKNDLKFENIIIENYIEGDDYRLYVLGDEVVAAFTRDRANVIGDGKSSIKQLVDNKNKIRASNPALKGKSKINLNHEAKILLKEKGYDFDSVPEKGEKVYLNTKNNVSSGGDPTDATDILSDEVKETAVKAAKAIPGLVQGGVDMIIDESKQYGHVLEINSRPHIRAHLFPMQGHARDIPKAILDYYFPETKEKKTPNIMYFDFALLFESFTKGYCEEFTLPMHPSGDVKLTRYEITNISSKSKLANYCKISAKKLRVNGHIKGLQNGKVSLVVAGSQEGVEKLIEKLSNEFTSIKMTEMKRNTPVKVGFEVSNMKSSTKSKGININNNDPNIDGYFPVNINVGSNKKKKSKSSTNKKSSIKKANSNKNKTTNNYYKKEYEKVINSTSWKITKPLRILGKLKK